MLVCWHLILIKFFLFKHSLYLIPEVLWLHIRRVKLYHIPFRIHQKFGEIPRDFLCLPGLLIMKTGVSPQKLVQRVTVIPIDLNLREHLESNLEFCFHKFLDILIAGILLVPELVAREAHNVEPLVLVLLMELFKLSVVAASKPTCASYVDNEVHLLALKGLQKEFFALDILYFNLPERFRHTRKVLLGVLEK